MIENYRKPELTIHQKVERIDNFTDSALNIVIIGPDYHAERFGRDPLPAYKSYKGNTFSILAAEGESYVPLSSMYSIKSEDVKCVAADGAIAFVDLDSATITANWQSGMPRNVLNTGTQATPITVVGDDFDTAKLADAVNIGDSIIFKLTGSGSSYSRICKVVGYEDADTLVLDSQFAPDSSYDAASVEGEIRILRTGVFEIDGTTVNTTTKKVTFPATTAFKLGTATVSAYAEGSAYIEYKALRAPEENERPIKVHSGLSLISANQEAELGYGVHCALVGGEGSSSIYAVRTNGDTVAAFAEALKSISVSAKYYLLVPITTQREVMFAVRDHVIAMRKADKKNFRRAYIGVDSFTATELSSTLEVSTVTGSILTFTEAELVAELGADEFISVGDKIKTTGGTEEYTVIGRDESAARPDTTIWLDQTPTITAGTDVTITKYPKAERVANDLIQLAESLDNRSVCLIWTSNGISTDTTVPTVLPNRFLAANIAGIRGRLPQHQGLTRTNVSSISASPNMYTTFDSNLQDKMAEHGLFLVTQEYENGPVFVRHQITTETDDGPLAYEDSIGVNFDMITFHIGRVCDKYIGKYNGTADTIKAIRDNVEDVLDSYKLADAQYRELGPPLQGYKNLTVGLHPILKDQFFVDVELIFALPLNRGVITLKATLNRAI